MSAGWALEAMEPRTLLSTTLPAGFVETTVVSGLSAPTAEAFAPDGRLFVAEKGGALRVVKNGQLLSTPFLRVAVDTYSERGLDGVAFDPNFASNGYVYVYYTKADPSNPNVQGNAAVNRLGRFTVSGANADVADPASELVLLDNIPSTNGNHNGGSLTFGADGMLYLGIGEAGVPANAQNLANLNGKVLRLNVADPAHLIPADNPFVGQKGKRGEIWAYGFRNPFTSAVKPGTSTLFIDDVGSNGAKAREEVDVLQKGADFGWPNVEGIVKNPKYADPLYAYPHTSSGAAIAGGTFYEGSAFPSAYRGKYFLGDYINHFIRVLDPATGAASDFATGADAPVDLDVGPDGALYYLSVNGGVHRIAYNSDTPTATLTSALRLRATGGRYYEFTVTYADNVAIDAATIDANDVVVTGPHNFSRGAVPFRITPAGNGSPLTVVYGVRGPGGTWDASDDGVYTITLGKRQVRDTSGNPVPAAVLGAFSVKIPGGVAASQRRTLWDD